MATESTHGSHSTPSTPLVYAITNVYNNFSFKLTIDGSRYKLWCRIFQDVCKGAIVLGHITGKSKPASDDDEDWDAIDARVKSWFYSTCEPSLLQIISNDSCTAKDLWDNLHNFFLNNKMPRMLQLQDQFRTTKKGASTINEFCHHLKHLADALSDVDCHITDTELVMQILRQLPPSYHSIVDVVTNTKPFPSFLEAKNMLLLHESREVSEEPLTDVQHTTTALYSGATQSGKPKNKWNKNRNNNRGASKGGSNTNVSTSANNFSGAQAGQPSQFAGVLGASLFSAQQFPAQQYFFPPPLAIGQPPGPPLLPNSLAYGPPSSMSNFSQLPLQAHGPTAAPAQQSSPAQQFPSAHYQAYYGQPQQQSTIRPCPPLMQPTSSSHSPAQYTDLSSVFQAMSV